MAPPVESLRSVANQLADRWGVVLDPGTAVAAGGGCIHRSFVVATGDGRRCFLKCNDRHAAPMFEAEETGLRTLAATGEIRVPAVIARGATTTTAWLLLEHLELRHATPGGDARLGVELARLHRHHATAHGFARDNFIGTTRQPNAPLQATTDWPGFFRKRRLQFQLQLVAGNGGDAELLAAGDRLLRRLPDLLAGHRPVPSLLHGDLWSGNRAFLADGTPVVYDPAVYHGDRETDIAMTRLFGGFDAAFYKAYNDEWPLPAGFEQRCDLYNLYHVLNHLNLFGGGYLRQALALAKRLLEQT